MIQPQPDAHQRIDTHEQVCAVRYEGINSRLKRLEGILIVSAGAIIAFMANLSLKLGAN